MARDASQVSFFTTAQFCTEINSVLTKWSIDLEMCMISLSWTMVCCVHVNVCQSIFNFRKNRVVQFLKLLCSAENEPSVNFLYLQNRNNRLISSLKYKTIEELTHVIQKYITFGGCCKMWFQPLFLGFLANRLYAFTSIYFISSILWLNYAIVVALAAVQSEFLICIPLKLSLFMLMCKCLTQNWFSTAETNFQMYESSLFVCLDMNFHLYPSPKAYISVQQLQKPHATVFFLSQPTHSKYGRYNCWDVAQLLLWRD